MSFEIRKINATMLSPEDVCITGKLALRPRRPIDLLAENKIFHSLANALTASPEKLLEQLVDMACVLCSADSACVSLLEGQGADQSFHWIAMGGAYKKYLNKNIPRNESPCNTGITLKVPQLFNQPGKAYSCFEGQLPSLIEMLMVPLPGAENENPIGTFWIATHNETRKFDMEDVRLMISLANFTAAALRMQNMLSEEQKARRDADAANDAKTNFLTNMSHEIRTPMNAVIGLSDILSMSSPLSHKQREFVRTLQVSARSLMDLINDVLDISKIEAESFSVELLPFSLEKVLDEVISMISMRANQKKIDFFVAHSTVKNMTFMGDANRIRQVLTNLCSNAVKFTEAGSVQIKVAISNSETANLSTVEIHVKDTGIGIEEDKIGAIFEKFNQGDASINRRYGGTGLGLTITKNLVERMNGTIRVLSKVGEGSTFIVSLPLAPIENNVASGTREVLASVKIPSDETTWPCVLLVEDYKPNVIVAQCYLEEFQYRADIAVNGIEAVQRAKEKDYLAILMDVQMHEMDGFEATQAIRANEKLYGRKGAYIIGMTAHAMAGDKEKCISAGMNDYIPKPFDPSLLKKTLDSLKEE